MCDQSRGAGICSIGPQLKPFDPTLRSQAWMMTKVKGVMSFIFDVNVHFSLKSHRVGKDVNIKFNQEIVTQPNLFSNYKRCACVCLSENFQIAQVFVFLNIHFCHTHPDRTPKIHKNPWSLCKAVQSASTPHWGRRNGGEGDGICCITMNGLGQKKQPKKGWDVFLSNKKVGVLNESKWSQM